MTTKELLDEVAGLSDDTRKIQEAVNGDNILKSDLVDRLAGLFDRTNALYYNIVNSFNE